MSIKEFFDIGGCLDKAVAEQGFKYEYRKQQVDYAQACVDSILTQNVLLAEGQTGTGKSLGYMIAHFIPEVYDYRTKDPITDKPNRTTLIISTNKKSLQDQLIHKDIPILNAALRASGWDRDLKVTKRIGRNNYVSKRRLDEFRSQVNFVGVRHELVYDLLEYYDFEENDDTEAGVFDNFIDVYDPKELGDESWSDAFYEMRYNIQSDSNDCYGKECPRYNECFYYRSKKEMDTADIIVCNHALVAYHLKYSTDLNQLLPLSSEIKKVDYVIDEGHRLSESIRSAYQQTMTASSFASIVKSLKKRENKIDHILELTEGTFYPSDIEESVQKFTGLTDKLKDRMLSLAQHIDDTYENLIRQYISDYTSIKGFNIYKDKQYLSDIPSLFHDIRSKIDGLATFIFDIFNEYSELQKEAEQYDIDIKLCPELVTLKYYLSNIYSKTDCLVEYDETYKDRFVNMFERIKFDPIDPAHPTSIEFQQNWTCISEYMRPILKNGCIITSATLQTDSIDNFNFTRKHLIPEGVEYDTVVVESPFPLGNSWARVYNTVNGTKTPRSNMYKEGTKDPQYKRDDNIFREASANEISKGLKHYEGRTLILTMAFDKADAYYNLLLPVCQELDIDLLKFDRDDNTDRNSVRKQFLEDKNACIIDHGILWEGFDAVGRTLECVAIPYLPYRPPSVLTKIIDDVHNTNHVDTMMMTFKQGVGRLIRSMDDEGTIMILDTRARDQHVYNRIIDVIKHYKLLVDNQRPKSTW